MLKRRLQEQTGFTLIEMLIVVILLGILAMLIIPQISVSTADANLNTLKSNLASVRNAIELYYHQHNQVYPGAVSEADGSTATTDANAPAAFLAQLTQYSDIDGEVSTTKTGNYIYGPYIKSTVLPTDPYSGNNDLGCDVDMGDITNRAVVGTTAWFFHPMTGVFFKNDATDNCNLL